MVYRSTFRTLSDFRRLLARLEQNRHAYNLVSFAQLRRILHRRIAALRAELRRKSDLGNERRAA